MINMMGDCGRLICGLHSKKVKPLTPFGFWLGDLVKRTIKEARDRDGRDHKKKYVKR